MSKKKEPMTRNYALVLYNIEDLKKIISQKDKIKRYAYILHDKDKLEDGTDKQAHYHLYINFYNNSRISWLETLKAKETFKENVLIERCASPEELIIYFQHTNEPEKHKYPITDITSNFDLSKLTNETELQEHLDIFEEINKISNGRSSWSALFRRYPKLIYSATSLKVVAQMLENDRYRDYSNGWQQSEKFLEECRKTVKHKELKPLPKNTRTPFDPKK